MMTFPDNDYLRDYKDSDFGSVVSTMQFHSMIGEDTFQIGDSGISLSLEPVVPGDAGIEAFKRNCKKVRGVIDTALSSMKDVRYTDFWTWARDSYDKNGVKMPMVGKIL